MVTYTEQHIEQEDIEIFNIIKGTIQRINPQIPAEIMAYNGNEIKISCHMLADAVSEVFGLEIKRGYYITGYEHSWIITHFGNIIDVYPWGTIGGPILITRKIISKYGPIYVENKNVGDTIPNDIYRRIVEIIKADIQALQ